MADDVTPPLGLIEDGVHRFPVRVYFEDTDLTGAVYHANYLRFMERARSDVMRALGLDQRAAAEGRDPAGIDGSYAVVDVRIRYRAPARLDDTLVVVTRLRKLAAATSVVHQQVIRGDVILTDADVTIAFVGRDGRPQRQPRPWVAMFERLRIA